MDQGSGYCERSVGGGDAGMSCETCASWSLKSAGAMAKQGMGNCAYFPRYTFVSQGCNRIKPAEAAVIEARVAWLSKHEKTKGMK